MIQISILSWFWDFYYWLREKVEIFSVIIADCLCKIFGHIGNPCLRRNWHDYGYSESGITFLHSDKRN